MHGTTIEKIAECRPKNVQRILLALVVALFAMVWAMAGGVGTARADIVAPTNYTSYGSSITWSIDDAGTLHIAPTNGDRGVLKYNTSDTGTSNPPWYSRRAKIKSVETAGSIELQGSMSNMFYNCKSLTFLDLSNFDTSNVTDMTSMFYNCPSLTSLDLSSFDTSNVTDMSGMFNGCKSLTSLDFSGFDTSNVTSMQSMFSNCSSLTSLNMSGLDTSKVTNMSRMFYNCSKLTSLDLSGFDTSKVTSMYEMFSGCSALASLDISSFDTSNVTDMTSMFYQCSSLTSLDLSNFDTSNVTSMRNMFNGCKSLTSLDVSSFDTSKVTNMQSMFNDCASLTSLDLSNFDTSNVTSMGNMFNGCKSLTSLDLSGWDTSKVEDMRYMFCHCESLTSLDVSHFDTSNVTSMNGMFYNCKSLTSLDVSSFDTSNVTDMTSMFYQCSSLTSLDLSNFDTSNVTSMRNMFNGCKSLTSLDVSSFDTSNVTNMQQMFYDCSSLTSLDVSHFDTSSVENMWATFAGCTSLTSVNLSNFDTSNVTNMQQMFFGCTSLTSLDISSFDTSKTTSMSSMFGGCYKLQSVALGDSFSFKGNNISSTGSQALLPTPDSASRSPYTGKWIRDDASYGPYAAVELRSDYGNNASTWAGTWVWQVKDGRATVAYDANGGQCELQTDGCETGGTVTLPEATRYGYIFQGWTTAANGSGEKLAAGTAYVPTPGTATVLHAQWEKDFRVGYTVRTYKQRSDLSGYDLAKTETHEFAALPGAMWTVEPEEAKGFVTPAAQTQQLAEGGATVFDLYYDRAKWTVSYSGNGADGGWMVSQAMVGGVPAELSPNNFTRTGHLFAGWNTEADGSGDSYLDGQRVVDEAGDGQALELYAQWVELEGDPQATQGTYTVRLKGGESVEFVGVPAGTVYEVSESSMPRGWEQVASDGSSGAVSANSRSQATVTNSYSASGEFSVTAHKRLSGGNLEPGEFSFELVDEHGDVVETVANGELDERDTVEGPDGESEVANAHKGSAPVEFSPVKVTAAGTYRYKVREVTGGDDEIDYDKSVFPVTVTAADAGHGNLACTVSFDAGDDTFDNAVKPASLKVSKSASGATSASSGQRFSFDVDVRDAAGNAITADAHLETAAADVPNGIEASGYTQASGSATGEGDAVTFDANGGYFADGNAALNTVNITRNIRRSVFKTDNIDDAGNKLADFESSHYYIGTVNIPGASRLSLDFNYTNPRGVFAIWTGTVDNPMSSIGSATKTISYTSSTDDNKLLHGTLEIEGDTATVLYFCYAYLPNSCPPDNGGYNEYTNYGLYMVATDPDNPGSATMTGTYYEPLPPSSGKAFAGWYTTPECTDGSEFDWEHYESEGGAKLKVYAKWADSLQTTSADVQVVGGRVTVELAAGESCVLSGLPAGATYAVAEREAPGWEQVKAQGAEGTLAAGETASASFSNRYSTSGSWAPSVTKSVTGPDAHMEAGEYSFAMADADGQVVATGSNDAEGNVSFTAVPLEASDDGVERTYRVYEVEGSDDAIEYDSHVAVFTVTPRDDGQGHMTADVSVQGGTEFVNTFRAAEVDMPMTGAGLGGLVALAALGGALAAWSVLRRRGDSREEE